MCSIGKVDEIARVHSCLSIRVVANRNTIPKTMSFVNKNIVSMTEKSERLGVIKATANQAAERLPETAESAFKNASFVFDISLL